MKVKGLLLFVTGLVWGMASAQGDWILAGLGGVAMLLTLQVKEPS